MTTLCREDYTEPPYEVGHMFEKGEHDLTAMLEQAGWQRRDLPTDAEQVQNLLRLADSYEGAIADLTAALAKSEAARLALAKAKAPEADRFAVATAMGVICGIGIGLLVGLMWGAV